MKVFYWFLTTVIIFSTLVSCTKDENNKEEFSWAQNGKTFFYDRYEGSDTVKDYLKLAIFDNQFFQNDVAASVYMDILDRPFTIKKGGLFGQACEDCDIGFFGCSKKFAFLYAPNAPAINQQLPYFDCGKTSEYNIKILNTDTIINVPMGIFHTYIMLHYQGDKSYWNANSGIIMYEKINYTDNRIVIDTFKLSRVE